MKQYDMIIVLGGGIDERGEIGPRVGLRVKEAVRLLKDGIAPRVIMSGKWGYLSAYTPPWTEAAAMKELAVQLGASPDEVLTEESSADTLGNAYFCKKLFLEPNGWRKVIVLMADHHAARAKYLLRKVLGPTYELTIHPVAIDMAPTERAAKDEMHRKSLALAKQSLDPIADGDDAAIWRLMSAKHPGYAANPEISKVELAKMFS